uniref:Paired domain-containing protein n=1 Tax=Ditylenchus dipsaci TaxID=166011 RepID=A0A915D5T0_9BILA
MSDSRAGIVRLYQEGHGVMDISRLLNVPKQTVSKAIKRFEETGSNEDRARIGRPVTATTDENIQLIADIICYCNE